MSPPRRLTICNGWSGISPWSPPPWRFWWSCTTNSNAPIGYSPTECSPPPPLNRAPIDRLRRRSNDTPTTDTTGCRTTRWPLLIGPSISQRQAGGRRRLTPSQHRRHKRSRARVPPTFRRAMQIGPSRNTTTCRSLGAESPALSAQTEPVQSPLPDSAQVQTREASKPPLTGDSIAASPGNAPQNADATPNADASAAATKHRRRHHTSGTTAAASGDSGFPNLDGPSQGAGDSTPKTAAAVPVASSGPTISSDSATAPGPNLGVTADHSTPKDTPLPASQAVPVGAKDGATPATQPTKADVDIFGALQDQPAAKHDSKGPDLGATPPAEKPIEGAPHRHHRKKTEPDSPAPEPIRTADQNPLMDSLDASKPIPPDPGKPADSKPAEKLDAPVPPHEHELKGPDAGVNPPTDQPPATEPPKHHRRRKSPPPDGATPDALHVSDSNPSPATESKPPEPEKAAPIPAPTNVAPTNVAPVPAPDPKKSDDWSAPSTASGAPPVKKTDDVPKIDPGPNKSAPAPEHELLGTLNDEHAEKHDAVTKGPDAGVVPPAITSPPGRDEPPKHRRRKKSPEAGGSSSSSGRRACTDNRSRSDAEAHGRTGARSVRCAQERGKASGVAGQGSEAGRASRTWRSSRCERASEA